MYVSMYSFMYVYIYIYIYIYTYICHQQLQGPVQCRTKTFSNLLHKSPHCANLCQVMPTNFSYSFLDLLSMKSPSTASLSLNAVTQSFVPSVISSSVHVWSIFIFVSLFVLLLMWIFSCLLYFIPTLTYTLVFVQLITVFHIFI